MSFALIFIVGLALGALCGLIKLPKIIGMLAAGIILGPYVLNVIDPSGFPHRLICEKPHW